MAVFVENTWNKYSIMITNLKYLLIIIKSVSLHGNVIVFASYLVWCAGVRL